MCTKEKPVHSTNAAEADRRGTVASRIQPIGNSEAENQEVAHIDWPLRDIKEPHPNDVLFGRGGGTNHHPGNKRYRKMVEDRKVEYADSQRLDKPLIALDIVHYMRKQDPPGRFLKLDEKAGLWHDVGDKKARSKTSQALREKPKMRGAKGKSGDGSDDDFCEDDDNKSVASADQQGMDSSDGFLIDNFDPRCSNDRDNISECAVLDGRRNKGRDHSLLHNPLSDALIDDVSVGRAFDEETWQWRYPTVDTENDFHHSTMEVEELTQGFDTEQSTADHYSGTNLQELESMAEAYHDVNMQMTEFNSNTSAKVDVAMPDAMKRESTYQYETVETKPFMCGTSVKRTALNRDNSTTANSLKEKYMQGYQAGRLGTDQEVDFLRENFESSTLETPLRSSLTDDERTSTIDRIAMDLFSRPVPTSAPSRSNTIEALGLYLDDDICEPEKMQRSTTMEEVFEELRRGVPKPYTISETERLKTNDLLEETDVNDILEIHGVYEAS